MLQQLIDHSPDIRRLREEGYELQLLGGYLLIHQVPYLNNLLEVQRGTLVTELTLSNNVTTASPETHVIYFIGGFPHKRDGKMLSALQHESRDQILGNGITVNHSFSNKPANGYADYFEKVSTYATILSAQAKAIDKTVTEKTFRVLNSDDCSGVFKYFDTNSSRANINQLNYRFNDQRIAIIGLGGTGSYVMDLVSKTPVKEIHIFDADDFLQHNAFRSPGAAKEIQLNLSKVDYYHQIYSEMHTCIFAQKVFVTEQNMSALDNMSHVFICIDDDFSRKKIIQHLVKIKSSFSDLGLGVNLVDNSLIGTLRVTTSTASKSDHLDNKVSYDDADNNEYSTNIQIADLNCLNAVLAVIKWKKLAGFYQDLRREHHSTYSINVSQLANEDSSA